MKVTTFRNGVYVGTREVDFSAPGVMGLLAGGAVPCGGAEAPPAGRAAAAFAAGGRSRTLATLAALPTSAGEHIPCRHLGPPTGERRDCEACGGKKDIPVMACAVFGECSSGDRLVSGGRSYAWCHLCRRREAAGPSGSTRLSGGLFRGARGASFNASLTRRGGRLLLAYRTGWDGAQVHVAELTEGLKVVRNRTLTLWHSRADHGREDPRFFEYNGDLWVAYAGVHVGGGKMTTNQMLARLTDDLRVAQVVYPQYRGRGEWEKNWSFFQHGDGLYAVYTIHPHRVLKVDAAAGVAEAAHELDWRVAWAGGSLRGGASPALVRGSGGRPDEYWCFFHGKEAGPSLNYSIGAYTFAAEPPFRPLRITPWPLLRGDPDTVPPGQEFPVVFPCGAVKGGDRWLVSAGVHDQWVEVYEFSHAKIERAMVAAT